ncbi:MAG: hypothetical protein AB7E79_09155 [Rhodospirillaceae bacterium]
MLRIFFVSVMVLSVACINAGGAFAKAVYAWVPDDRAGCCRGVLEVSDEAYYAAQAAWQHDRPVPMPAIERFFFEGRFTVLDELKRNPENPTLDVTVSTNLTAQPESERCCEWDIQLKITETGLEGRIRLKTRSDEVVMSGAVDQWGLDRARSDVIPSGIVCGIAPKTTCSRATGRWMLVSAPAPKK